MAKELFELVNERCQLVLMSSIPQIDKLNEVPIRSNIGYVRVDMNGQAPQLYFVNKAKKRCDLISATPEQIADIDKKLKPYEAPFGLFLSQLKIITTTTGHSFTAERVEDVRLLLEKHGAFDPTKRARAIQARTGKPVHIEKPYECEDVLFAMDDQGETLLCNVIDSGESELADMLISAGSDVNFFGLPLLNAFANTDLAMVNKLIAAGAVLPKPGEKFPVPNTDKMPVDYFENPLSHYLALLCKRTETIDDGDKRGIALLRLLCNHGVDVNQRIYANCPILPPIFLVLNNEYTSHAFKTEAIRILIRAGLDVDRTYPEIDERSNPKNSDNAENHHAETDKNREHKIHAQRRGRTALYQAAWNGIDSCIIELVAVGATVDYTATIPGDYTRLIDRAREWKEDRPEVLNALRAGRRLQSAYTKILKIKPDCSASEIDKIEKSVNQYLTEILSFSCGPELLAKYFDNLYQGYIKTHSLDEIQLKFFERCVLRLAYSQELNSTDTHVHLQPLYLIIAQDLFTKNDFYLPLYLQNALPLAQADALLLEWYRKEMGFCNIGFANTPSGTFDNLLKLDPILFREIQFRLLLLKITFNNPNWFTTVDCLEKFIAPHLQEGKEFATLSPHVIRFCIGTFLYNYALFRKQEQDKDFVNILKVADGYLQESKSYRNSEILRWEINKALTPVPPTSSLSSFTLNDGNASEKVTAAPVTPHKDKNPPSSPNLLN